MFVVRRPPEMWQRHGVPQYFMCLVDLRNAYRPVDRTLFSSVSVSVKWASLSYLLFKMFFAAVLNVALASCPLDSEIVEDVVIMQKRSIGAGAKDSCGAWEGEGNFREMWRGILYEDDADILSQSSGSVRHTMGGVIVNVCPVFGLTVSEV